MIELQHLYKTFDAAGHRVEALRDVSLTVGEGEVFGVIGSSGAGKSTLVRCINLLERPDRGRVLLEGVDLTALDERALRRCRRGMGMIFQQFNLMPSRRVCDNVAYPLADSGLSRAQKQARVAELLELVELSDKAEAWPAQLSGGQKQRVAIARALATSPRVLLCDECTSALDPQTTLAILSLLKKVNRDLRVTIVLITHEMAVVKEICTRAAVLEHGQVAETGEVLSLFSAPQSEAGRRLTDAFGGKLAELRDAGWPILRQDASRRLALLRYPAESADEALISRVSREFSVDCNILFGNMELLQGRALGSLGLIFSGEPEHIDAAVAFLRSRGVRVEVAEQ